MGRVHQMSMDFEIGDIYVYKVPFVDKKEAKSSRAFVIRAVSRNNDVSDPVSFKL